MTFARVLNTATCCRTSGCEAFGTITRWEGEEEESSCSLQSLCPVKHEIFISCIFGGGALRLCCGSAFGSILLQKQRLKPAAAQSPPQDRLYPCRCHVVSFLLSPGSSDWDSAPPPPRPPQEAVCIQPLLLLLLLLLAFD